MIVRRIMLMVVIAALVLVSARPLLSNDTDKIPITTTSDEARGLFLKGRDLLEKLKAQESIRFFSEAVAKDPQCAIAEFNLAVVQPNPHGFFEHLKKAVALAKQASEGERLTILALDAGVRGEPQKQKEYLVELVKHYPNDERAHTALGNFYFGQQDYLVALDAYTKATKIAPSFSAPYNQLGYVYRFLEKYPESEKAFKTYTDLIPDDPNPYDSYAELLMKLGRFEESIACYRKALAVDPYFASAMRGVAWNFMFQGKYDDARAELGKSLEKARDTGEQRTAYFAMATLSVDEGKPDLALKELQNQCAIAEKLNDAPAKAGDLGAMGLILSEMGDYNAALARFDQSLNTIERSDLKQEVKDLAKLGNHFNLASVAAKKGDVANASAEYEKYRSGVEASRNPNQIRLSHELAGMIALVTREYGKAIEELNQANQQNPYNLYRIALAYAGKGDSARAREFYLKAAHHNTLPIMNYAFIRTLANKKAAEK